MSKIVGIDLGTTNSLVATVDAGIPFVIADNEGNRLTPSVVHIPGANAEPIVGHKANRVRVLKPAETVYSAKRFMGRRGADIPREEMLVTYPVKGQGAGQVTFDIHGRSWTPEEISAEVLKKLKRDAEAYFGEAVTRAVITVPAYFNDAQRNATKKAGEIAGFTVERIVNEPTAAALAYGLDKLKEKSKIAVYDLGGGTFDLSILELNNGVFQVLSTNGNTRLGGDDLDKRVIDFLVTKIKAASGPDAMNDNAMLSRIREVAEQTKIRLSTEAEVEIQLPFLSANFSFSYKLTRVELENLSRDIILRTRAHCLRSLSDAKLEAKDLDQVILVGGQTRMPLVRQLVSEWFGCVEFEERRGDIRLGAEHHKAKGPQLNTSQNPDEAVALGAAIQAEILSGGFKNLLLLDVTPLSLGIETFGGLMNVIIPRNSTIPVKAGEMFTTAVDNQRSMLIHVVQGERERVKDNWSLGRFEIEFDPAPKGVPRVGVQFEIDANGILHALARDVKTGHQKVVQMQSAVDVDDAEVQKMVEDSVEHAFDDLRARQWIEAKLRAAETITATRKTMAEYASELETDYKKQLDAALEEIESVLAGEDPRTKTGDPKKLKEANAKLDEVTKPLADHAMDQAMEAMLRKRGLIPPTAAKAVFLDRDGVINQCKIIDGKPYAPLSLEEFVILPGVGEACHKLKRAGFLLVVATNQPDVGRGTLKQEVVEQIHAHMCAQLPIDRVEVCYHPGQGASDCECRKPKPGLLLRAARELKIDLGASWMVGDRWRDIDCGHAAGCRTVFIDYQYDEALKQQPNYRAKSLLEAAELILNLELRKSGTGQ